MAKSPLPSSRDASVSSNAFHAAGRTTEGAVVVVVEVDDVDGRGVVVSGAVDGAGSVVGIAVVGGGGGGVSTGAARSAAHDAAADVAATIRKAATVRPELRCTHP
jgi:hypothetical protein